MSLFSSDVHRKGPPPEPRPSATVLVARDVSSGSPEIFMVRRHAKSGFMGGAHVFPGGTVDQADRDPGFLQCIDHHDPETLHRSLGEASNASSSDALAIYVSAIRETLEEAGIFLGTGVTPAEITSGRGALLAGEAFLSVVRRWHGELSLSTLVPLARWVTPKMEARRYDAQFFLARHPEGQRAVHDDIETTEGVWLNPQDALERADAGDIQLPPPTLRTLFHLRSFTTVDAMLADASSRPSPRIQPEISSDGRRVVLALPGDPRHSESQPAFPGPTRIVLDEGRWSLEPRARQGEK
jgi:8-oxo-dGTP pyrophosphatase MutT (NUDIX family)